MEAIIGSIITAIITSGLALVGIIITNAQANKSIENKILTAQAVTDTKLENLTNEVRRHNEFAIRIPTLETEVRQLKEDVKELRVIKNKNSI